MKLILLTPLFFLLFQTVEATENRTLLEWCQAREYTRGEEYWNFLHIILDKKISQLSAIQANEFKNDCQAITSYLKEVNSVYLNYKTSPNIRINFSSAKYLPSLERISAYEYPSQNILFETLDNIKLKELRVINAGISTISFGKNLSLEKLQLDKNPLTSLGNIKDIKDLKTLSISGTTLKDLSELEGVELEELLMVGMNTSIIFALDKVTEKLEKLDLRDTYVYDMEDLRRFTNLRELKLTGISGRIDLRKNTNLERLYLNEFNNGDVKFPSSLPMLKKLTFSNSDVDDISFLSDSALLEDVTLTYNRIQNLNIFQENSFPHLSRLNLSVNPILNVKALSRLQALDYLNLYRTPLATNQVPKTEQNCPTTYGPLSVRRFCSK